MFRDDINTSANERLQLLRRGGFEFIWGMVLMVESLVEMMRGSLQTGGIEVSF